eukprot:maker-scaffold_29-snap-gene-3.25-mRNA-1 protein AED:0.19 eAED:0.43 QI:0/0.33/0.25/1/0/0/4/91/80
MEEVFSKNPELAPRRGYVGRMCSLTVVQDRVDDIAVQEARLKNQIFLSKPTFNQGMFRKLEKLVQECEGKMQELQDLVNP